MDMTIAQQLQYVFNNDYQGYPSPGARKGMHIAHASTEPLPSGSFPNPWENSMSAGGMTRYSYRMSIRQTDTSACLKKWLCLWPAIRAAL